MKAIQTRTMVAAISIQFWNVTPQIVKGSTNQSPIWASLSG